MSWPIRKERDALSDGSTASFPCETRHALSQTGSEIGELMFAEDILFLERAFLPTLFTRRPRRASHADLLIIRFNLD